MRSSYDSTVRRVAPFLVAGAALLVAVLLSAAGVGEEPGAAVRLAGARARRRAGADRAAADLVVRPPDPRAVARRLDVPRGAPGLQQDLRRRAAPRDARRGRRSTSGATSCGSSRAWLRSVRRRRVETPDERIAWLVVVATIPAAIVGAVGEDVIEDHLGEPWQIAILLAVFASCSGSPTGCRSARARRPRALDGARTSALAQSLALMPGVSRSGITITARPLPRARPRRGRALLVPAARADRVRRGALQGAHGRRASATCRRAGQGRSSSARSPPRSAASSRSGVCSATCAGTTTRSSSSTG